MSRAGLRRARRRARCGVRAATRSYSLNSPWRAVVSGIGCRSSVMGGAYQPARLYRASSPAHEVHKPLRHTVVCGLRRCLTTSRAACPAMARPSLSRWARGSTLSTPAGGITVSNSTACPGGDRGRPRNRAGRRSGFRRCPARRHRGLPVRGDAGPEQAGGVAMSRAWAEGRSACGPRSRRGAPHT